MEALSAAFAAVFMLGGVPVEVGAGNAQRPAQPTQEAIDAGLVWDTRHMAMNVRVLMTNGTYFKVKNVRPAPNGGVRLDLALLTGSISPTSYTIPAEFLDELIWTSNAPIPIEELPPVTPQPEPTPTEPPIVP